MEGITIKTCDGASQMAEIVTFLNKDNNKTYVLYTINDNNLSTDVEIYASIFSENDINYELKPISTVTEWGDIQEAILNLTENKVSERIKVGSFKLDPSKHATLEKIQKICEMSRKYLRMLSTDSHEARSYEDADGSNEISKGIDELFKGVQF